MPIKTILFILFFAVCSGGALLAPILGVCGYVAHYSIGPERQWWAAPIRHWGIRYSYLLALLTAVGMALNWRRLRFGRSILVGHEKLILLFLGMVWLSVAIGEETVGQYSITDHPSVKLTKLVIFALMLTHIVTDLKNLDRLFWVLIIGSLILGLQAYDTPRRAFVTGRLESVGGPDFREANVLAAYLGAMLPIIGVQFLRSKWIGKAVCLLAGAFATNAIVLTRSRGAIVGIAGGALVAVLLAPKRHRIKILTGLVIAMLGGLYLTDPYFRARAGTIRRSQEERDQSAQGRFDTWAASVRMLKDRPLGVGAGNFHQSIGQYDARYEGRDAHNTFVRCWGELGVPGIAFLVAMIANAAVLLKRVMRRARALPRPVQDRLLFAAYGVAISLAVLLACGLTITLLYVEVLWWVLVLPVCLARAMDNSEIDAGKSRGQKRDASAENLARKARCGDPLPPGGTEPNARSSWHVGVRRRENRSTS